MMPRTKNVDFIYCDDPDAPKSLSVSAMRSYAPANVADGRGYFQGKETLNREHQSEMTEVVRSLYWDL